MIPAFGFLETIVLCTFLLNELRGTARQYRLAGTLTVALFAVSGLIHAQDGGGSAIDELLDTMRENTSIHARKTIELPSGLQGKLIAIAEFDDDKQNWQPMDGPQDFGVAAHDRISVLGYEVGQDGFLEAQYVEITDRRVVSYTGITADRRLSINLYDDQNDAEHLVLQVRIGPRQLRYLLLRPSPDTK